MNQSTRETRRATTARYEKRHIQWLKDNVSLRAYKEQAKSKGRKAYEAKKEKEIAELKKWEKKYGRRRPIVPISLKDQRRKEREENAEGSHTEEEWVELRSKYGNKCLACGGKNNIVKDHIKAMYNGGRNSIDNLQPLCSKCNIKKGLKTIDYRPDSEDLGIAQADPPAH